MYVVLSGAKLNVGDYLITDRALRLLREFKPDAELVQRPGWQPLNVAELRGARAIIILGGPGYQPGFHPKVYPLVPDLRDLPCPVIPLGMGWKGIPGDAQTERDYCFSEQSQRALDAISQRTRWLGCRDTLTARMLTRHGLGNVLMTGCPVWYDLPSIGRPMRLPGAVRRVVFTPAQHSIFATQSLEVAAELRRTFPDAELICALHRGIDAPSEWTKPEERAHHRKMADGAAALGFAVRDVSGDLARLGFYDECELHVGYRVHAHIQFLSQRLPSLLLHEDGRGIAASQTLGVQGVDAFVRPFVAQLAGRATVPLGQRIEQRRAYLAQRYDANPDLVYRVRTLLAEDVATGFSRYAGVGARIDAHLPVMRRFIEAIP